VLLACDFGLRNFETILTVRETWFCRLFQFTVCCRFRPYSITLSCSLAGLRPAPELVASWLA